MDKKFLFGSATAAFQCEGALTQDGRGKCIWDLPFETGRNIAKYSPEPASDFYNQYEIDFKLAQEYGIKSMRVSIAWSRIFPKNNSDINLKAVEHYHQLFKSMLEHDILPNVCLLHFDSPEWVVEEGDFLNPKTVINFKKFAEFCFKEYGEIVMWSTINEITPYSADKFLKGAIEPYMTNDYAKFVLHQHGMLLAHAEAVNSFKELGIKGTIGLPNSNSIWLPINDSEGAAIAAEKVNTFYNYITMDALFLGKYSENTLNVLNEYLIPRYGISFIPTKKDIETLTKAAKDLDWIGFNYYATNFADEPVGETRVIFNSTGAKGSTETNVEGLYKQVFNPNIETTDWDWPIYPDGLRILIEKTCYDYGFKKPIYITENGYGGKEVLDENETVKDIRRIKYVQDHFNVIAKLRDDGINVAGYYLWSHMDMFSWNNGYNKRYGLFFVDFETQKRYVKQSAKWWKEKSESNILIETEKSKELAE